MNIDTHIDGAQERVRLDVNKTSSLLQRIRQLQRNNVFWARECEKLYTQVWYKFFLVVSYALNLAFIFGFIGWEVWEKYIK